jgi:hypothetical protein
MSFDLISTTAAAEVGFALVGLVVVGRAVESVFEMMDVVATAAEEVGAASLLLLIHAERSEVWSTCQLPAFLSRKPRI